MTAEITPWPPTLAGTPTVAVIDRAIERHRLSHSLLLHGDDLDTLELVAHAIADRLLNCDLDPVTGHLVRRAIGAGAFPSDQHPDCYSLRPAGKMRQIGAEATRTLVRAIDRRYATTIDRLASVLDATATATADTDDRTRRRELDEREAVLDGLTTRLTFAPDPAADR